MRKLLTILLLLLTSFGLFAQPANDNCGGATSVTPDGSCQTGTNVSAIDNWVGEQPEYLETDVLDPNVMIKLDGNSFRCECGGNVFAKLRSGKYRCNSCEVLYEGE